MSRVPMTEIPVKVDDSLEPETVELRNGEVVVGRILGVPPMPEGFTDQTAWDAVHWNFSADGSMLDEAVIGWQRENQDRARAAAEAAGLATD